MVEQTVNPGTTPRKLTRNHAIGTILRKPRPTQSFLHGYLVIVCEVPDVLQFVIVLSATIPFFLVATAPATGTGRYFISRTRLATRSNGSALNDADYPTGTPPRFPHQMNLYSAMIAALLLREIKNPRSQSFGHTVCQ
jgi:hypothetical protein